MSKTIKFTVKPVTSNRTHFVTPEDVQVVLARLPREVIQRLTAVHLNDESGGNRRLGYTTRRRREIALCALPKRLSFTHYLVKGQSPEQFGALRGMQWPTLAIRRFMLYDVLLHEIGHLQIVDEQAKGVYHRFAREGKAQAFAMYWNQQLYKQPFQHQDPVHNAPGKAEMKHVKAYWPRAMEQLKRGEQYRNTRSYALAQEAFEIALGQIQLYAQSIGEEESSTISMLRCRIIKMRYEMAGW